ncbi:hypothetical protein CVT24_002060 [Panaeolus cyanescens]|uniref:DUF6589 domain-containing protein n=1 Tax=Panaeolus cyanescens TaxID=181874 RepID=A0A409X4P3_9AGAR|nr:hypothetical protein CVT24_002060 [Panaeolus cyanescens]
MVKSLSKDAMVRLKREVQTLLLCFAYDNFDTNFQVAHSNADHHAQFVSATSATAIPLYDGGPAHKLNLNALNCSSEVWARDPVNPWPPVPVQYPDPQDMLLMMHQQSQKLRSTPTDLSPHEKRLAWHIRDILIYRAPNQLFRHFIRQNGSPQPILPIPLHQTNQIPCRAMDIKESTTDGNAQVVENLLKQGGLGAQSFSSDGTLNDLPQGVVDISDRLILFHGDLLTIERLQTIKKSRRIEKTPKDRFQFVVGVPGLFHFLMACADAMWRIWLGVPEGRVDKNSLYEIVGVIRPSETGKILSKPGFRRVHEVIQQDVWGSILNCWEIIVRDQNSQWDSLEAFAAGKPTFNDIVEISHAIVRRFVAVNARQLSEDRKKPDSRRDKAFENQCLRNRDELLYLETYHALNSGDIGRVEETFLDWIYMFRAVGKHKYSTHLLRFEHDLKHLYPEEVSKIIRMNWLINPTGLPFGFRGVDWLVERNNLYTKVIYGGHGSNRSLDRIIEESPLIRLFQQMHVTIENGFHLTHQTIRHSMPILTVTMSKLRQHYLRHTPHVFTSGRSSRYEVPNTIEKGMGLLMSVQRSHKSIELEDSMDIDGEGDNETELDVEDGGLDDEVTSDDLVL